MKKLSDIIPELLNSLDMPELVKTIRSLDNYGKERLADIRASGMRTGKHEEALEKLLSEPSFNLRMEMVAKTCKVDIRHATSIYISGLLAGLLTSVDIDLEDWKP